VCNKRLISLLGRNGLRLSNIHQNVDDISNVPEATYPQQVSGPSNINMPCNEPLESSIPIFPLIQTQMAHFPLVQLPSSQVPVASHMTFSLQVGSSIPIAENSGLQMMNTVPLAPMLYHEGITNVECFFLSLTRPRSSSSSPLFVFLYAECDWITHQS